MPKMSLSFTADDLTPEQISALLTKLKIQKKSDYRKDTQPLVQVSYCMGDVIEFNSGRKCSSVFVELQNGTQWMYMKDTDAMMLPLLRGDISNGPIYATIAHTHICERQTPYTRSRMERHPLRCCLFCVGAELFRCREHTQRPTDTYRKRGN